MRNKIDKNSLLDFLKTFDEVTSTLPTFLMEVGEKLYWFSGLHDGKKYVSERVSENILSAEMEINLMALGSVRKRKRLAKKIEKQAMKEYKNGVLGSDYYCSKLLASYLWGSIIEPSSNNFKKDVLTMFRDGPSLELEFIVRIQKCLRAFSAEVVEERKDNIELKEGIRIRHQETGEIRVLKSNQWVVEDEG